MTENEVKIQMSKIIGGIGDKSTENLVREIIFNADLDWQEVWETIKKHKPEMTLKEGK